MRLNTGRCQFAHVNFVINSRVVRQKEHEVQTGLEALLPSFLDRIDLPDLSIAFVPQLYASST